MSKVHLARSTGLRVSCVPPQHALQPPSSAARSACATPRALRRWIPPAVGGSSAAATRPGRSGRLTLIGAQPTPPRFCSKPALELEDADRIGEPFQHQLTTCVEPKAL